MVAGDHDQGVVVVAARLERVHYAADMVIDLGHQSVVGRAQLAHRSFIVGVRRRIVPLASEVMAQHVGRIGMGHRLRLRRRGAPKTVHFVGIVHGVVGLGCDERRMRAQQAEVQEPRTARRRRHRFDSPADHERRIAILGPEYRRGEGGPAHIGARIAGNRAVYLSLASRDVVTLCGEAAQPGFGAGLSALAAWHELRETGQHAGGLVA